MKKSPDRLHRSTSLLHPPQIDSGGNFHPDIITVIVVKIGNSLSFQAIGVRTISLPLGRLPRNGPESCLYETPAHVANAAVHH